MKVQEILRDMMNLIDGVQSAPAEQDVLAQIGWQEIT